MADKKITELTQYNTPVDADVLPVVDTGNNTTKKITWAYIKSVLKTYFDTLYATLTGTQTLTNKTLTTPIIASLFQDAGKTKIVTMPVATDTLVGKATTDTLTNKRHTKRAYTTTSLATLTPEIDTYDMFSLTAQAEALDIANHSTSTPTAGECIFIDILPDATPRDLTYGTNYVAYSGIALPSTTVASKRMQLLFIWLPVGKYTLAWVGQEE